MKSFVAVEPCKGMLVDLPMPEITEKGQIIVKLKYSGVCMC